MNRLDYFRLCETLWSKWLSSDSFNTLPGVKLQFDYCPEPYLLFGQGPKRLVVLTTNPGAGMPHQHRDAIRAGRSLIQPDDDYAEIAVALARFYEDELASRPAGRRIRAMQSIARNAGFDGVLQVECLPYHSHQLPAKARVIQLIEQDPELAALTGALSQFLVEETVLAVTGFYAGYELAGSTADVWERLSPFAQWQALLMGIDLGKAEVKPIVHHGTGRVTGALLWDVSSANARGLYAVMGSNNFPGTEGCARISSLMTGRKT